MNLNQITLIGKIVEGPTIFERMDQRYIISFSLSTFSKVKNQSGVSEKVIDYHDVTHMTSSKDFAESIQTGDRVCVTGEYTSRTNEAGQHKWRVKAYNIQKNPPS